MYKKSFPFLCIFFVYVLTFTHSLFSYSKKLETSLKQISLEERKSISRIFNCFVRSDQFAYTLFFETKPVAFGGFYLKHENEEHEKKLREGWSCWRKYEHLFPHPKYFFIEEKRYSANRIFLDIFLINKKSILKLLDEKKDIFIDILGESFSPETFLASVEKEKSLRPLLNHDESLLGILLGFGVESSRAYKEHQFKKKPKIKWHFGPIDKNYVGINGYSSLDAGLRGIAFSGNPHSKEVQTLIEQYDKEMIEICKIYDSNSILFPTLEKLMEE